MVKDRREARRHMVLSRMRRSGQPGAEQAGTEGALQGHRSPGLAIPPASSSAPVWLPRHMNVRVRAEGLGTQAQAGWGSPARSFIHR